MNPPSLKFEDFEPINESELFGHIYKAKRSASFGLTEDGILIAGLELIIVDIGNGYDSLQEMISNVGSEFICNLPSEGLVEGAYYESYELCTSTDWESGYCDDTEIYIKRVL